MADYKHLYTCRGYESAGTYSHFLFHPHSTYMTHVQYFLGLIVESAAIYTWVHSLAPTLALGDLHICLCMPHSIHRSWIIFYSVTHQMNSLLQFFAVGPIPSIVGITNALIHVRVGLGQTIEQILGEQGSGESVMTAPIHFITPRAGGGSRESGTIGAVPRPGMFFGEDVVSPGSPHSNSFSI